jgi:hypothetical protein
VNVRCRLYWNRLGLGGTRILVFVLVILILSFGADSNEGQATLIKLLATFLLRGPTTTCRDQGPAHHQLPAMHGLLIRQCSSKKNLYDRVADEEGIPARIKGKAGGDCSTSCNLYLSPSSEIFPATPIRATSLSNEMIPRTLLREYFATYFNVIRCMKHEYLK